MTSRPCRAWGWRPKSTARRCSWGTWPFSAGKGVASEELAHYQDRLSREGKTAIFLAVGGLPVGVIAAADTLKPRAAQTVAALEGHGVEDSPVERRQQDDRGGGGQEHRHRRRAGRSAARRQGQKSGGTPGRGRSGGHGGRRHQRRPGPGRRPTSASPWAPAPTWPWRPRT